MKVEIWSDVVCPWCFIGKRHFETALASFEHRDEVQVAFRSFELDPGAPPLRDGDYVTRLARKYRVERDEAQAMIDRITAAGADAGLDFRFDIARFGNTFDAHRLLHLAGERGLQRELKERLLVATFSEGAPVADHDSLARLAAEVGIDGDEARAALSSDAYGDAVRADEREAGLLDIHAVPYFVVERTYGLSGAQRPEVLLRMLNHAWTETHAPAR